MILAVFAILLAFVTFVGKGEGGGRLEKKSKPPSEIYYICCICYIGCICYICGKGVRVVGGQWVHHHRNRIIVVVFAMKIALLHLWERGEGSWGGGGVTTITFVL